MNLNFCVEKISPVIFSAVIILFFVRSDFAFFRKSKVCLLEFKKAEEDRNILWEKKLDILVSLVVNFYLIS